MSPHHGLALALRTLAPLCFCGFCLAPVSSAQAPKTGAEYYQDATDLGFKFKAPDGWAFIPPQPNDPNLIGMYSAPSDTGILFPKENSYWSYTMWIVRFDRRGGEDEGKVTDVGDKKVFRPPGAKNVTEWIDSIPVRAAFKQSETAELKIRGCEATEYIYTGENGGVALALYAAVYKVHEKAEVAIVFNGPGDSKKWSKFEGAFRKIAKTFVPLAVEAADAPTANLGGGALREAKRAKLEGELARMPGWELYETENYFIVSNNDDQEFLDELMERLEAIRKVYEEHYPPSLAAELNALAAKNGKDKDKEKKPEEKPAEAGQDPGMKTAEGSGDPMERSRTSVVRVCLNEDQYKSYGGPEGSAGYWAWTDEELVIYDDKATGGRGNTWATLNHEAFHQYCFYFFGNLSPHSWYNEGTGDFYSGYQLKNNKFTLKPFDWREREIQQLIRESDSLVYKYVPLQELVRYTQQEYYGGNKRGVDIGANYATGWSLVYFLRNGPKQAKLWNPAWNTILDTYLRELVVTDDLDQAVEKAFAGVDWTELETAWKDYILKG